LFALGASATRGGVWALCHTGENVRALSNLHNELIAQHFRCKELRIGSPATGDNYYPRPALIAKLLRSLKGDNVAFLGPRRTGKTSCLEQIKAQPGHFVPILINLEKHDTVEAWFSEMLAKLRVALAEPKGRMAGLADKATAARACALEGISLKPDYAFARRVFFEICGDQTDDWRAALPSLVA